MSTEAFEAAKANARDILDAAFWAYSPLHAKKVRELEGVALCGAIENAIATAMVFAWTGLAPKPGEVATRALADFLAPAKILNDSVRVLGVYAAPEWDELSEDGKKWLAAFLREALAHVPGELEGLRAEVAYWRADLAARLLFDTGDLEHARDQGDTAAFARFAIRVRSHVASYRDAVHGEWHPRCDICGGFVLPGEAAGGCEEASGHWNCFAPDHPVARVQVDPETDLAERINRARLVLAKGMSSEHLPPLHVPCPDCADGFVSHGDRHARTRMDVCPRCAGTHQVPAATGTSPETSAPQEPA